METLDYNTMMASIGGMGDMLAQAAPAATTGFDDASAGLGKIIKFMNVLGIVLAFGGLLFAAAMFIMGQTDKVIFGVIGAAVGGLAWVIVKAFFEASKGAGDDIDAFLKILPLLPCAYWLIGTKAGNCRDMLLPWSDSEGKNSL